MRLEGHVLDQSTLMIQLEASAHDLAAAIEETDPFNEFAVKQDQFLPPAD